METSRVCGQDNMLVHEWDLVVIALMMPKNSEEGPQERVSSNIYTKKGYFSRSTDEKAQGID